MGLTFPIDRGILHEQEPSNGVFLGLVLRTES